MKLSTLPSYRSLLQASCDQRELDEVVVGLRATPKRLPTRYLYDEIGSELFEQICEQPEYYLTRVETEILQQYGGEIGATLGEGVCLVEYGSGNARKTRLLLRQLVSPAAYVPVEISAKALTDSVMSLRSEFPELAVVPHFADFTRKLHLSLPPGEHKRKIVFFPGSTLGNFDWAGAVGLLGQMRSLVGQSGGALIGVDLKKSPAELEAAYNDAAGVTAEFTLNMLSHINRSVGADFRRAMFFHRAVYNASLGRIDTHLVSRTRQTVRLPGLQFHLEAGEEVLVEYSYKYSTEDIQSLGRAAGMKLANVWTDNEQRFALVYLVPDSGHVRLASGWDDQSHASERLGLVRQVSGS